jgi:hypothetical protein
METGVQDGRSVEHDPEKWNPVSRLREAVAKLCGWLDASAGEGRSQKITLNQIVKATIDSI